MVKIFGCLLQLPRAPQSPQPGGLIPLWSPISRSTMPQKKIFWLAGTPETPLLSLEGGQCQSMVFEAQTKNHLADEGTFPIVFRLPRHALTSYEHAFAHLPLLHTCHSTPQPCSIILQAPCDLSIPWAMELMVCSQNTHHRLTEYQP